MHMRTHFFNAKHEVLLQWSRHTWAAGQEQLQPRCNSKAAAAPQATEGHAPALEHLSRVSKEPKETAEPKPYAADSVCHMHPPGLGPRLRLAPAPLALSDRQQATCDEQAAACKERGPAGHRQQRSGTRSNQVGACRVVAPQALQACCRAGQSLGVLGPKAWCWFASCPCPHTTHTDPPG